MKSGRVFSLSPRSVIALMLATLLMAACTGAAGDSWAGIASDPTQNVVYVSYEKSVAALDASTGEAIWKYGSDDAKFFAVPVVDDGALYVGDYEGRMHSVDLETGEANWIYEPDRQQLIGPMSLNPSDRVISGAALDGDKVFFGLGSRDVVAVSRETAEEVWTFGTDHGVWGTPLYVKNDPTANGQDVLYVVSLDHYLYAINPENGDQLWRKDLGGAAPGGMVYDGELNRIYVGTFVSELVAVDLVERDIVARYETENWLWGRPTLEIREDGTEYLYFGDLEGWLYAVQVTEDGFEEVWKRDVADGAIRSSPLLVGELVVVGSKDNHVYAVSREDGTGEWDEKVDGDVLSELVALPGDPDDADAPPLVVIGTTDSDELVIGYQSDSGDRVWRYKN